MATQHSSESLLRIVVVVLGTIIILPLLMMALLMPMMGWSWANGMAGGFSPMWGIGMMLVWLVVLLGIGYLLYRGVVSGFHRSSVSDPALQELRLAYARGDLTDEEFEERHARLQRED